MKHSNRLNVKTVPWEGGTDLNSRRKQIQFLIENDQPFALSRYETRMLLVQDASAWNYELIIWQTRQDKEAALSMLMTRETFYQLIHDFNMRRVRHNRYGSIYTRDDKFHSLRDLFEAETSAMQNDISRLSGLIASGKCDAKSKPEKIQELETLKGTIKNYTEQFYEKHGIIRFRFNGEQSATHSVSTFELGAYVVTGGQAQYTSARVAVKKGNRMTVTGMDKESFLTTMRTVKSALAAEEYEPLGGLITTKVTPEATGHPAIAAAIATAYVIASGQMIPSGRRPYALLCNLNDDGTLSTPDGAITAAEQAIKDGASTIITTEEGAALIAKGEPDIDVLAAATLSDILDIIAVEPAAEDNDD